jgi:hypothetical protein
MTSRQCLRTFSIPFLESSFYLLQDWLSKFFSIGWSSGWKFAKEKKSSDFAYFYHISLYKIDPRAEFHEIRYLDPILPGNAFNIWFFWLSMTPCNFLWGSLDGPPPKILLQIKLCLGLFLDLSWPRPTT